jgi:hypothetical protein
MKTLQDKVNQTLHNLLTQGEVNGIQNLPVTDLESFIYQRLTSKKFRKTKMDEACIERTKNAIHDRISQKQALKVVYPQGGYKLWRFPSSPEADWAEFFNIAYLVEYLLPIANNYQPGVELVYYMHTLLMELHDNLTTEEIQAYVDSFQRLIDEFQKHLPKNFTISILRDADIYERDEYFQRLEEGKIKAAQEYVNWPEAKKQDYIRMAELNIKWQGKEDWTKLSGKERQQKLNDAAHYEMAATSNLERVFELVKAPGNVLVFTKATKDFIGIGSTRASMAKYWVGFGVLETSKNGQLQPRILTPSQYELTKQQPKSIPVTLLKGKNFEEISVFDKVLDFRK